MTDISNGGVAVAVATPPARTSVIISGSRGGFGANLPCDVVGVSDASTHSTLHLRFRELNMAERAFVRHLIRDAQKALEGG
jgi:hypothetical protein